MADLPSEILLHHVFLKLPVKSLSRCKCVCKAWNCVIRDPEFVKMHLLNQNHEKLLIATCTIKGSSHRHFYSVDYGASHRTVKLNLNFPAEARSTEILGSSNGLLCVGVGYRKRRSSSRKDDDLLIWNPSTGDSKLIPETDLHLPYSGSFLVGFAYDTSINDGKIVRVTNFNFKIPGQPITSQVDIYSIKSNSWNTIKYDAPFSLVGVRTCGRGYAVNGSIYWQVYYQSNFQILGFNLRDSKFRHLQLPCDFEPCDNTYLKELGGTFFILQNYFADRPVVWTMKEDQNEEWIKLIDVDVYFLNFEVSPFLTPVCLMRNGKIFMSSSKPIKKYVLHGGRRNKKEDFSIHQITRRYSIYNAEAYVESLVSPSKITQGD
ncbi:hypothetical protein LguiA_031149 [Lonicera macranthoides]